jgi:hypothetical protein
MPARSRAGSLEEESVRPKSPVGANVTKQVVRDDLREEESPLRPSCR